MPEIDNRISELHQSAPLTDVHIHPSLKAFLFKRNLWRHYMSGKAVNPFASRSDFKMLEKGSVKCIWATHYVPERQLFNDCFLFKLGARLFSPVYDKLRKGSLFVRLNEMMDMMEHEVNRKPEKTEMAFSAADVKRITGEGKIAVIHNVEGAHILEGDVDNLDKLAKRGVALLTLSHFYANQLATNVIGIPRNMIINHFCGFKFGAGGEPPLTDFGKAVLQKMKTLNMLVDITHCTPDAREAIYAELNGNRPIIATHIGVSRINPDSYNLTDDEIKEIARGSGVIGVIFMNYWLDPAEPKDGLPAIWRTIEHIHKVTNSWDYITLGTDFDGFTDPPDDVQDASQMPKVTRMLLEKGVPEDAIRKILGGNAMRVLETGWR